MKTVGEMSPARFQEPPVAPVPGEQTENKRAKGSQGLQRGVIPAALVPDGAGGRCGDAPPGLAVRSAARRFARPAQTATAPPRPGPRPPSAGRSEHHGRAAPRERRGDSREPASGGSGVSAGKTGALGASGERAGDICPAWAVRGAERAGRTEELDCDPAPPGAGRDGRDSR